MPIRMVEDENQEQYDDNNIPQNDNNGGGGIPIQGLLPLLLFIPKLFGKPKLLFFLLIVGGLFYFLSKGCNTLADTSDYTTGGHLDKEKYDQTEVFEPLSNNSKNQMPDAFSLMQYAPTPLNQGRQGSCVAWASAYAARTIMAAREYGINPNQTAFSPAFLYNQIALQNCQGSYVPEAMKVMQQYGSATLNQMPYDDSDCSQQPDNYLLQQASKYKINGYQRLTLSDENDRPDMVAIRQYISKGAPVVIGMMVGGSFMQDMENKDVWIPYEDDYNMSGFGGHAMCVIAYDDYKSGGAFLIQNSWGTKWGKNGRAYVRYKDFDYFVKEVYGMYPMGAAYNSNANVIDVKFGLWNVASQKNIPLQYTSNNIFRTTNPVKKGDKFKIEITNKFDCYTYIFGEETDGSSYILFPYTKRHSPFCGITGTRLFPKDFSLQADNIGNKDIMAVIISKKPLDYEALNKNINITNGVSFTQKFQKVIESININTVNYKSTEVIEFSTNTSEDKIAKGIIIEINKQ
jgi:C1A family cysteine protease